MSTSEEEKDGNAANNLNINYSPVTINGSMLEGGGQILRIAIALAGITRRPILVTGIRGNRPKPGLMAQHLTGLRLARDITGGQLSGDTIGSMQIRYAPGRDAGKMGQYLADAKTAGSTTLLLQAALPIAIFGCAERVISLTLRGGTNVSMAPQVDFTTLVLKPILEMMRIHFELRVARRGYYPKGGGDIRVRIAENHLPLPPINLVERGKVRRIEGYSFVGGRLPVRIAHEMAEAAKHVLKSKLPQIENNDNANNIPIDIRVVKEENVGNFGTGSGIVLVAHMSNESRIAGSALGSRDLTGAQVGIDAAEHLVRELSTGAAVDCFIQDQLIIFMALASGRSSVLTGPLTLHTQTAIHVIEQMLPQIEFVVRPLDNNLNMIECDGIAWNCAK